MKSLHRYSFAAAVALLAASHSFNSLAEPVYYRWEDSRGNVINSDRPPPKGVDYEVLDPESELSRSVGAEEGAVPLEVAPRPGNEFAARNKAMEQRVKRNAEMCKRARSNLEAFASGEDINLRNAQGEVQQLTPQEIAEQKNIAETQIRMYCN